MRAFKRMGLAAITVLALMWGAAPARADAVTDWNAIMERVVSVNVPGVAPSNPLFQVRWAAITQLAVFEAVNSITGDYQPYAGGFDPVPGAEPEAAAIAAAYYTLVELRPSLWVAQPDLLLQLTNEFNQALLALPGNDHQAGVETGRRAAAVMLALRANDGWVEAISSPAYIPTGLPGDFNPAPAPAFTPGWGFIVPFGLQSGSQFRCPPPPAMNTGRYAADYNEVKLLGRAGPNPFRPADRELVARFYNAASVVQVWNPVARQESAAQGKTLSENARIFALLNMAMMDASIAVWETKYVYRVWRPVAAIRGGDTDGNRLTEPDASWVPLLGSTPPHPSYASGHGALSGAARLVLERVFGEHGTEVTLTHPSQPGVVLNYTAWKQITDDISDARVYGGIHFRFDQEAAALQGRKVGNYILRHHLRSR
ncbi:MAG TPA: vanadium-dependent haloperoxidase [Armatimonadota bacterium]|nr:vanadium-dependent haloperoxidase [Armatimonadota bacterium]